MILSQLFFTYLSRLIALALFLLSLPERVRHCLSLQATLTVVTRKVGIDRKPEGQRAEAFSSLPLFFHSLTSPLLDSTSSGSTNTRYTTQPVDKDVPRLLDSTLSFPLFFCDHRTLKKASSSSSLRISSIPLSTLLLKPCHHPTLERPQ